MIYCVGLTGNLASGKSTVAQFFAELGIDVINADAIAKQLTQKDSETLASIKTHFGTKVIQEDGQLDRAYLREIIFADPAQRQWLEQLLHPLIRQSIEQQINHCQSEYCIIEIPLHIDKKLYPYLNRVLLITAPIEKQIARVQARDKCSKDQALAILATQPTMDLRIQHADDIINNDGDLESLRTQVQQIHKQYLKNKT